MTRTLTVSALVATALFLGACCSGETRFWAGQDAGGNMVYAVDTASDPLGHSVPAEFLDASGRRVAAANPRLAPVSEAEYRQGTNGGSYRTNYCPKTGCWSEPVPAR
jgi:hypothetical protein